MTVFFGGFGEGSPLLAGLAPGGKWDQVGTKAKVVPFGIDDTNPENGSGPTGGQNFEYGHHRKLKWRIGEGFIAEISEGDTFEKPAPMESWSIEMLH